MVVPVPVSVPVPVPVSVPADKTVGVGRSAEHKLTIQAKEENTMDKENKKTPAVDAKAERAKIQKQFENDSRDIMAIGQKHW